MTILALECSSQQQSAAVGQAGGALAITEVVETGGRGTAMIGLIENALHLAQVEREQIECIAIGLGPGSYTGIRSAIALAQGWELAAGQRTIRFAGLSSAESVAVQAKAEGVSGPVAVVIDAQRQEFYVGSYDIAADPIRAIRSLRLATFDEVQALQQAGETLVGPEVTKWFPDGRLIFPRASVLARMVQESTECGSAQNLQPIYLRETQFVKAPAPRPPPSA